MPHYHLHLHNAHLNASDEEGLDAENLDAAKAHALAGIRGFLGHELKDGRLDLRGQVDITSDAGNILLTVRFVDAVIVTMP